MSRADPPARWRVDRDVLGRGTEAEIDHGGRTELPDGAVLVERYQGTVGTALDPGPTWARGSASYRVEWPEATVASGVRLDLCGDADAYEVQLDWRPARATSFTGPGPGAAASPATSADLWPGGPGPAKVAERGIDPLFSFCP